MKSFWAVVMALVSLGLLEPALAGNPTGTWKSTFTLHNQQVENTFKLRLDSEGPILTGAYSDDLSNRPAALQSLALKGEHLTFSVIREASGEKFTVKFNGELRGDTITGKATIDYGDRTQTSDWIARRQR